MVKKTKILLKVVLVFCLVILIPLVGCSYKEYSGNHADLYTVAINSALWNLGHSYGADKAIDSQIEILEKDKFGRTLFTYREKYYIRNSISFSSLMVLQCASDGNVYYYEDFNYLLKQQEAYSTSLQNFDFSEIEYLKNINDWDKELDLAKCTKKKISRNKQDILTGTKKIEEEVLSQFNPTSSKYSIFLNLLTVDVNENSIVYGLIDKYDNGNILFAAFVNMEGEVIDWFVPDDLYNYQKELRKFKAKNGWVNIV